MRTIQELGKHPSVNAYRQHGFIVGGENETQIFGICPFCANVEHKHNFTFYVNLTQNLSAQRYTPGVGFGIVYGMNLTYRLQAYRPPVVNATLNKSLLNIFDYDVINISANATGDDRPEHSGMEHSPVGLSFGQIIVNTSGYYDFGYVNIVPHSTEEETCYLQFLDWTSTELPNGTNLSSYWTNLTIAGPYRREE